MRAGLLSSLEKAIDEWIENQAEHDERSDGYIYDGLHVEMARAAAAVYDASFDVQIWMKTEGNT